MKIQAIDNKFKKLWEPVDKDLWYYYTQQWFDSQGSTAEDKFDFIIELKKLSESPANAAMKIHGIVVLVQDPFPLKQNPYNAIGYWISKDLITVLPTNRSLIIQLSNFLSDDVVYEFDDRVIVESYIRRMAVATTRTICEIQQRLNAEKITEYEADFWQQAEKDNYIARCLDISAFKEVPANYPEILPTILHEELEKAKKRLTQPRSQCQYCDYYIPPGICNAFHTPSEDVINCPDYIALDRDRRNALQ